MRGEEIGERVAAELVLRGARELPGDAAFGDDGKSFHRSCADPSRSMIVETCLTGVAR